MLVGIRLGTHNHKLQPGVFDRVAASTAHVTSKSKPIVDASERAKSMLVRYVLSP